MKKTLAAVLAAAMALSTATVAFAADTLIDATDVSWGKDETTDGKADIQYDKDVKKLIGQIGDFDGYELAEWYDEGIVDVNVVVTQGSPKLKSRPSVSLQKVKTKDSTTTSKAAYKWDYTIKDSNNKVIVRKGSVVTKIPVIDGGTGWDFAGDSDYQDSAKTDLSKNLIVLDRTVDDYITEKYDGKYEGTNGPQYNGSITYLDGASIISKTAHQITDVDGKETGDKILQLKLRVDNTFDTSATDVAFKLRVTFKKASPDGLYSKGSTYTTEEFKFKAEYGKMDVGHDMQLTLNEVDARNVILDGSDLYDEIGNDTFTIAFEDIALFEGKASASQKDLNLFYNTDEMPDIAAAYPNVDFEFITFKGRPSVTKFINSGKMTFPAIGGKNTTIYQLETAGGGDDGDILVPLTGSYDSTYNTITVKGIKSLSGTFVIASDILEVESDEDNEPVSSAPVVEEPSSEAPSTPVEKNPSTGAC